MKSYQNIMLAQTPIPDHMNKDIQDDYTPVNKSRPATQQDEITTNYGISPLNQIT